MECQRLFNGMPSSFHCKANAFPVQSRARHRAFLMSRVDGMRNAKIATHLGLWPQIALLTILN